MPIKGLLFDKDGTLIDYVATWMPVNWMAAELAAGDRLDLVPALMAACGYDEAKGSVRSGSLLAAGNTHEIASGFAAVKSDIDLEHLVPALDRLFVEQGQARAVAVPGLEDTIARLQDQGLVLGIATSDSEAGIHGTLGRFGVLPRFDFLCGYDSGHGVKPESGMLLAFCAATGLAPGEVVMVGDNSHDMEMGRAAGAGHCVGVLTGTSARHELETLADAVLESIALLPDWLAERNGAA